MVEAPIACRAPEPAGTAIPDVHRAAAGIGLIRGGGKVSNTICGGEGGKCRQPETNHNKEKWRESAHGRLLGVGNSPGRLYRIFAQLFAEPINCVKRYFCLIQPTLPHFPPCLRLISGLATSGTPPGCLPVGDAEVTGRRLGGIASKDKKDATGWWKTEQKKQARTSPRLLGQSLGGQSIMKPRLTIRLVFL